MESGLSIENQLYQLEERLLHPEVRRSEEDLLNLLANDFVEFGSSGRIFNRQQIIESLTHSDTVQTQMVLKDFRAKILAPDVVLTTFYVTKHDEQREEMKNSLRSSIWKLIDCRWQMVFHQGTPTIESRF